jgi:hypothetical protein
VKQKKLQRGKRHGGMGYRGDAANETKSSQPESKIDQLRTLLSRGAKRSMQSG